MDLSLLTTGLDSVGMALGLSASHATAIAGAIVMCGSVLLRLYLARKAAQK